LAKVQLINLARSHNPCTGKTVRTATRILWASRAHGVHLASSDGRCRFFYKTFRKAFFSDKIFLEAKRRSFEALVGRVGTRFLRGRRALVTNRSSRSITAWRFCSCERSLLADRAMAPSSVRYLRRRSMMRFFSISEKADDEAGNHLSWALVEVLLTFWPPGPEARTKSMQISGSGIRLSICPHFSTRLVKSRILCFTRAVGNPPRRVLRCSRAWSAKRSGCHFSVSRPVSRFVYGGVLVGPAHPRRDSPVSTPPFTPRSPQYRLVLFRRLPGKATGPSFFCQQ
jgi:hypothetical protein